MDSEPIPIPIRRGTPVVPQGTCVLGTSDEARLITRPSPRRDHAGRRPQPYAKIR
jgi:hypothetical protein